MFSHAQAFSCLVWIFTKTCFHTCRGRKYCSNTEGESSDMVYPPAQVSPPGLLTKRGDFQMQGVEHHHPAGSGLGLHALSLSLFQKAMRMPLLVFSPAERSKTTCASRDIQQKKACEGSSYALSSRAFTCPN